MVLTSLSSDAYREENSAYSLQRKQIFSAKQHNKVVIFFGSGGREIQKLFTLEKYLG